MRNLVALAHRFWARRRGRNRMSLLSTALAVALFGILVILTASMKSTVEASIQSNFGIHHMIVEYRTDFRSRFRPEDIDLVRRIPGVLDAGPAYMSISPTGFPIYMGVLASDPISRASAKIMEGALPGPGQVALPKGFADRMKVGIGDQILLPFPPDADQTLAVSGFTQGVSMSSRGGIALFDMDWLQRTANEAGQYQAILIALTRPEDLKQARLVESRLEKLFPTSEVNPLDELRTLRRNMGGMGALAAALGAFALLASLFLIAGNFVISLQDRTRELGAIRAIGASKGKIVRIVLAEALLMGITGSASGVVIALVCAYGLIYGAGRWVGIEPSAAVIPWGPLAATGAAGVAITMMAASLPAFRASRTSVVAALSGQVEGARQRRSRGGLIGLLMAFAGMAAILFAGTTALPTGGNEQLSLVALGGGLALLVGTIAGLPLILPPLIRAGGTLGERLRGAEFMLAVRNATRYVGQAKFMFASLSVGIALCLIVISVLSAVEQTSTRMMKQQFPAPFVLRAAGDTVIAPEVAQRVRTMPGVDRVTTVRQIVESHLVDYDFSRADPEWVQHRKEQIQLMQELGVLDPGDLGDYRVAPVDLDGLVQAYPFEVVAGDLDVAQLQNGGAVVLEDWANNLGLRPGDTIQMEVGEGEGAKRAPLRVIALVKSIPLTTTAVLIDHGIGASAFSIHQDQIILIHPDEGADDVVRESLKGLQAEFSHVTINDSQLAKESLRREYGQRLAVVIAAVVAILAAAAGSLVTMIVTIITERRREFGLMRAAGASAHQVRRLVGLEILLVGGTSTIIAVFNSTLITWAMLRTLAADSPVPSVGAMIGCTLASLLILWVVVRIGIRNLNRSSVVAALSAD